jgi:hypothetical protein
MIKKISHDGHLLGLIILNDFNCEDIQFFTPPEFSQQLGYMNRPKGYTIPPHVHNEVAREVLFTNEVLFIKSGRVRVDFYNQYQLYLESHILKTGDTILLASGGHGFEMLEPSQIIEVKQGPYAVADDKTRFTPIDKCQIRIVTT